MVLFSSACATGLVDCETARLVRVADSPWFSRAWFATAESTFEGGWLKAQFQQTRIFFRTTMKMAGPRLYHFWALRSANLLASTSRRVRYTTPSPGDDLPLST